MRLLQMKKTFTVLTVLTAFTVSFFIVINPVNKSYGYNLKKYRGKKTNILPLSILIKNALRNPDITSSILKTEGRKEKIAITKALPEPVAGIGLTDANGFNNPGIGVNSMSDIGLSISQKIPFPSKLETKSRINKYSYMSSKAKTRALKIDTAYLVKESYYNLALLEKQIIVVKYNRLLLNMILKDISQKYGTGSASAPAYIRTMLEDAGLKSELFSLNKAKAKLIYLLSELTGFEPSYIKSRRAVLSKIKEVGKRDKTKEDIKTAYKYNPEITSSALKTEGRREEIAIAKALPEPVAGIGFTDANGFNDPGIGVNSMSNIGFSISQKIPFPSKLETKSRINKYLYMSSKAKTEALKIDTAYLVKETYYNLALIEKQTAAVKYDRLLLNIILKDISQKYGTGSASAPAYIRTMLEDAGLKSELFSLNEAKAKLIYLLGELTGLKSSYIKLRRAVLPKIKGGDQLNEKENIKTAYKYNPELKSLKYLAKKSDYETAYAKESYLPDFYLKAGYGDRYSMVPVLSASVGLSLPVYFNSYQKPLINKAEKDRLSSIYDISWEKLQIIKSISVYVKDMRLNKNNYKLYENLYIPEAKLLFKAERASFGVKRASVSPLLDSFRKLINSGFKRDIYNAKYYIDKSRLEQIMGKIR